MVAAPGASQAQLGAGNAEANKNVAGAEQDKKSQGA